MACTSTSHAQSSTIVCEALIACTSTSRAKSNTAVGEALIACTSTLHAQSSTAVGEAHIACTSTSHVQVELFPGKCLYEHFTCTSRTVAGEMLEFMWHLDFPLVTSSRITLGDASVCCEGVRASALTYINNPYCLG